MDKYFEMSIIVKEEALIPSGRRRRFLVIFSVFLLATTATFSFSDRAFAGERSSEHELDKPQATLGVATTPDESSIKDNSTDRTNDARLSDIVMGLGEYLSAHCYEELRQLLDRKKGRITNALYLNQKTIAITAEIPQADMSSFTYEATSLGLVRYVERNVEFKTQLVPNDPYWGMQWGPRKIKADWAWNTTVGESSVLVAVIDTGIDYNHPDLKANYVPLGFDWVNNDTDPLDDQGHGTHCAGIIAASLNNGLGLAGIAQVHIMAEKGLDANGSGYTSDLAKAIIHATDQGADIISMSWGAYGNSELLHEAITYAYSRGVLLIAAAGNEATTRKLYPAAYEEVVAVAATDENDNPAYFSNYGGWIELAAPGVNIYSTISSVHDQRFEYPYFSLSGTSMACPHVAGLAALIESRFPNITSEWIPFRMRYTADDLGESNYDVHYGYGRINAGRALEDPLPQHDLLVSSWETPAYMMPNETATVNITVFNFGVNEGNFTVELMVDGGVVDFNHIVFLQSGESTTVTCHWTAMNEGTYNLTAFVLPVSGETIVTNNALSKDMIVSSRIVCLFKNFDPWNYPADEKALSIYGIPCAVFDSTKFGSVVLSKFLKVVIAADQDQSFYLDLDAYRWWFDDYVSNGGILEIHAADGGFNGGFAPGHLPCGLLWKRRASDNVLIVNNTHPIMTMPYVITEEELDGWDISCHGYFQKYPAYSQIIAVDEHYGGVVQLVFTYGSGLVIASGMTLEYGYESEHSRILENTLLYTIPGYPTIVHDVAVVSVILSDVSVYAGSSVNITVVVSNEGNATETFRVAAYQNDVLIATRTVTNLAEHGDKTIIFTWNTRGLKELTLHMISAAASKIMNEVDTDNNVFVDGKVKIRMLGDINDDDKVNILDVVLAARAYGSKPDGTNWNAFADLAPQWGVIDILDIVTLTSHYAS